MWLSGSPLMWYYFEAQCSVSTTVGPISVLGGQSLKGWRRWRRRKRRKRVEGRGGRGGDEEREREKDGEEGRKALDLVSVETQQPVVGFCSTHSIIIIIYGCVSIERFPNNGKSYQNCYPLYGLPLL